MCCPPVAVMHIAWYSEDRPFAVGYADGNLLIGSKDSLEKGAVVVIDAHKVTGSGLIGLKSELSLQLVNSSPSVSQESISNMKWSPNGQILLTCAKEDTVKLWAALDQDSGQGSGWRCLQGLRHPSLVNAVAWCGLPGRGPKPLSMLAM